MLLQKLYRRNSILVDVAIVVFVFPIVTIASIIATIIATIIAPVAATTTTLPNFPTHRVRGRQGTAELGRQIGPSTALLTRVHFRSRRESRGRQQLERAGT